jgi:hypothetical protein
VGVADVLGDRPAPKIAARRVQRAPGVAVEVIKGSQVSVQSF